MINLKFGQLIEFNMRNNVVEKLVTNPFVKNENWAYILIISLKFYTACFYCMASCGLSKYIENKLETTCFDLILSFLKKLKEVWN